MFVCFQSIYGFHTQSSALGIILFISQLIVDALAAKYIDLIVIVWGRSH